MTLLTLATGRLSSAFFSKMTRPVEASQRIALGLVRLSGVPAYIADSSASPIDAAATPSTVKIAAKNFFMLSLPALLRHHLRNLRARQIRLKCLIDAVRQNA